jgi:hypothetical protein
LVRKSEERDHFEGLDLDGMAKFKLILKRGSGRVVDFIDMFQHRVKWRIFVNIINLRDSQIWDNFLID